MKRLLGMLSGVLAVASAVIVVGPGARAQAAGPAIVPVVPGRILETRSGPNDKTVDGQFQGIGAVAGGSEVALLVAGRHGVPGDAAAVMLNVTAVGPDAAGFLTVYPCGSARPLSSSVNYAAGQVVPNAVLAKVGDGGTVCIWTKATTHVLADVTAYVPAGDGGGNGGGGTPSDVATFISPLPAPHRGTSAVENHNVTIGPDGTAHLVYVDGWGTAAWYATCQANCSTSAGWQHTQLFTIDSDGTSQAGTGGIGVDASGTVHALFDGWGWDGWSLRYGSCSGNCTSPASWTFTDVADGSTPTSADTSTVLMVAPDGHVGLVAAGFNEEVEWEVEYLECAASCTNAASWTHTDAFVGYPVMAVRDAAGVSHVLFHQSNVDREQLHYARCASDCTTASNWDVAAGGFPAFDGASLGVTASGRVLIGYLQGELGNAHDRRYVVRSCAGACTNLATWSSFTVGADWEGWDGAAIATVGEEVLLVTTINDDLLGRFCETSCHQPSGYGEPVVLDTRTAIGADVNPWFHAETDLCSSANPNWWTQNPAVAWRGERLVAAHNPYATYVCTPDTTIYDLPAIGRVRANF